VTVTALLVLLWPLIVKVALMLTGDTPGAPATGKGLPLLSVVRQLTKLASHCPAQITPEGDTVMTLGLLELYDRAGGLTATLFEVSACAVT
jgi:hypothetical protein